MATPTFVLRGKRGTGGPSACAQAAFYHTHTHNSSTCNFVTHRFSHTRNLVTVTIPPSTHTTLSRTSFTQKLYHTHPQLFTYNFATLSILHHLRLFFLLRPASTLFVHVGRSWLVGLSGPLIYSHPGVDRILVNDWTSTTKIWLCCWCVLSWQNTCM